MVSTVILTLSVDNERKNEETLFASLSIDLISATKISSDYKLAVKKNIDWHDCLEEQPTK